MPTGLSVLDFGPFPGASDAWAAVTGQAGILAGSKVEAWLAPAATADHSADEHQLVAMKVTAGSVIAGTGFTIYGVSANQVNDPAGRDPMPWGQWNVNWAWG